MRSSKKTRTGARSTTATATTMGTKMMLVVGEATPRARAKKRMKSTRAATADRGQMTKRRVWMTERSG